MRVHPELAKWFLVGAWPFAVVACWCALAELSSFGRAVATIVVSLAVCLLLHWGYTNSAVGVRKSDNIAEAIVFGINADGSRTMVEQFRTVDPKLLQIYKGNGSVNTIDNWPSVYYETAWGITFGRVLVCDAKSGVGSGMELEVSRHPYISVRVSANPLHGICTLNASVAPPAMVATGGFTLTGDSSWPRHPYILDLPVWNNTFGLRLGLSSQDLRLVAQGYSPMWRSFAIDDPREVLELHVYRKGGGYWAPLPQLDEFIPSRITLETDLMFGGPKITRQFKLVETQPKQVGRGDDASQVYIWAFTWKRTLYGEKTQ